MMHFRSARPFLQVSLLGLALLGLSGNLSAGETITVAGTTHRDAEMVEICREGAIYRVAAETFVTLPWDQLSDPQRNTVKAKFATAIPNALYEAVYVEGTVFQVTPDGVVIQVSLTSSTDSPGYKNGARILTSGLVIVRDLPTSVPQGEGAAVTLTGFQQRTFTYDMGIAVKEIPYLTIAKPLWAMEQEWKNITGEVMHARLLGLKDGKGLFEKGGKRFVYEVGKLDEESQKRVAEIAKKLEGLPIF